MLRAPRARYPAGHPVGWDFEALNLFERALVGEVGVCSDMQDQGIGWDDEVPVEDNHVMRDRAASIGSGQAHEGGAGPLGTVRRRDSSGGSNDEQSGPVTFFVPLRGGARRVSVRQPWSLVLKALECSRMLGLLLGLFVRRSRR